MILFETEGSHMTEQETFYVTTPIYYPSGHMHIGHTYTTVAADTITRFKKMTGFKTYFLTGTDEHGQKIERSAKQAGLEPKEYIDGIVEETKALWKLMNIEYDDFIRTTDERHIKTVQLIFRKLFEQGDIYKGSYEGQYCTQCEAFWTSSQILDGNLCPDCKRSTELVEEESYFFRMSKYQDWLIEYIRSHPDFIQPPSRANEMLQNFLLPGLQDLSVSRTTFTWGIPVDFDPKHVIYVWIDALSNYISALGYGTDQDDLFQEFWPAQVHLVGKEIMRFHTIYWPILLHALGLPLPKQIFGHGWLLFGSDKMSKSKGNVVYSQPIIERYGADALRYYLMREMTFGMDGNYTNEAFLTRTNADLANDLGNLVSRTVAMVEKYFDGIVPIPSEYLEVDLELIEVAKKLPMQFEREMNDLQFSNALQEIWKLIAACNRYIDMTQPWILGREDSGKSRLSTVLYVLSECIRFVAVCIGPVMPGTPQRIYEQLGLDDLMFKTWNSLHSFGLLPSGIKVKKGEALFPRADITKELEALAQGQEDKPIKPQTEVEESLPTVKPIIGIDEFEKLDLRVAKVISCEEVPKSDRLLKFLLQLGDETRTVVSGIAKFYDSENLVGKNVVLLANLAPRKIRGIMSEGMILSAATHEDTALVLLSTQGDITPGSRIS
ncbi:MAG: methionine--tRNA ligase [Clostridiales bacterium]|nr:methionine--tRNA ligase [Clostridiales bacterium]